MYRIDNVRLREAMVRCGIKQVDLAEKLGVTDVTISRYATGVRMPRPEMLHKIAEILETTPEYLTNTEFPERPDMAFAKVKVQIRAYGPEWTHKQRKELMNLLMDAGEERG